MGLDYLAGTASPRLAASREMPAMSIAQSALPSSDPLAQAIGERSAAVWRSALARAPGAEPGQTLRPPSTTPPVASGDPLQADAGRKGYAIEGELGQGGMGVIYAARQKSLGRMVALKTLRSDKADTASLCDLFVREAAIIGALEHPNIVPIYELGLTKEGRPFYAMRRIVGQSWNEVIRKHSLEWNLSILLHVADAVAYAHAHGVIHRDLKPENVMLGAYGEVLVLDWGLAAGVGGSVVAPVIDPLTACAGTPAYMAPEMACGAYERIGVQSDIYLLGAILFEVRTGGRPHQGRDCSEVIAAAANNILAEHDADDELTAIALKAMATDPAARQASVKEFQDEIRAWRAHRESLALAAEAQQALTRAQKHGGYGNYQSAMAGFRQALALWPQNPRARSGLPHSRQAYAGCALQKGDLDLAASLLDKSVAEEQELLRKVARAQRERAGAETRAARQWWLLRIGGIAIAALLLLVIGGVAFFQHRAAGQARALAASERQQREVQEAALATERERQHLQAVRAAAWPHYARGLDLAQRVGRQSDAVAAFTAAIVADPAFREAYAARGLARRDGGIGDFAAVCADFVTADKLAREAGVAGDPYALRLLGDIHRDRRPPDLDQARIYYQQAVTIGGDDAQAAIAAVVLAYLDGRRDACLKQLVIAERRHPGYWELPFIRAMALLGYRPGDVESLTASTGDAVSALGAIDNAIRLQPTRANLYSTRAFVRITAMRQGKDRAPDWTPVFDDLGIAMALDPAQENYPRIRTVPNSPGTMHRLRLPCALRRKRSGSCRTGPASLRIGFWPCMPLAGRTRPGPP